MNLQRLAHCVKLFCDAAAGIFVIFFLHWLRRFPKKIPPSPDRKVNKVMLSFIAFSSATPVKTTYNLSSPVSIQLSNLINNPRLSVWWIKLTGHTATGPYSSDYTNWKDLIKHRTGSKALCWIIASLLSINKSCCSSALEPNIRPGSVRNIVQQFVLQQLRLTSVCPAHHGDSRYQVKTQQSLISRWMVAASDGTSLLFTDDLTSLCAHIQQNATQLTGHCFKVLTDNGSQHTAKAIQFCLMK